MRYIVLFITILFFTLQAHSQPIPPNTNAETLCSGTTTYLDGEGNCDDISSVYEPAGITESDISDLSHTTDTSANTICTGTGNYLDGEGNCDALTTNATHTGDVTGDTALTITADAIEESMLKAVDAAVDEECLTYESTTGDFEWQTCSGGGGHGNGANCAAGEIPLGVDDNGAVEGCYEPTAADVSDFDTEVTNNASVIANTAKVSNATHTGDVAGSTTLTIQANSVALGVDTTGDYVGGATASQGLVATGTEDADLGIQDCAANEIMKRNGGDTAWECASDVDTDTNTNADTICTGTSVYLDGEGNCDTINAPSAELDKRSFGTVIDGGGSAITTGQKGYITVPFACTISEATVLLDQSGSIVIDVWKDTYANYPPVDADSITASAPPTVTTATKSQDSTLTGWTTSVTAGDIIGFNVDSITTATRATLIIQCDV